MATLTMETLNKKNLFGGVPVYILSPEEESQKDLKAVIRNLPTDYTNLPLVKLHSPSLAKFKLENLKSTDLEVRIKEKKFMNMKGKWIGTIDNTDVESQDFTSYRKLYENKKTSVKHFFEKTMKRKNIFRYLTAPIKMEDVDLGSFCWDLESNGIFEGEEDSDFDGINTTWIYAGNSGVPFEFHLEDANMRSLNIHLFGESKIWFAVDNKNIPKVEELLRKHCDYESELCPVFYRHKHSFVDMGIFASENIPVYKVEQNPGDIIITNSFHQGFNLGFNLNIAVNIFTGIGEEYKFIDNGQHCPANCEYENEKSVIFNGLKNELLLEFNCKKCGDIFKSARGLAEHLKKKCTKKSSEDRLWKCPMCDKHSTKAEDHINNNHSNVLSVYCTLCRKRFGRRPILKEHWRTVHKNDKGCKVKNCEAKAIEFDDIFNFHNCPQKGSLIE